MRTSRKAGIIAGSLMLALGLSLSALALYQWLLVDAFTGMAESFGEKAEVEDDAFGIAMPYVGALLSFSGITLLSRWRTRDG